MLNSKKISIQLKNYNQHRNQFIEYKKLYRNKKPRAGKWVALCRERAFLHTKIRLAESTDIKIELINILKNLRWANPKTNKINK